MAKLAIIIEGGVVQDVVSDDPSAIKLDDILVIDYDTDGSSPICKVRQSNGTWAEAHVSHFGVVQATIGLDDIDTTPKRFWASWYSPKSESFTLKNPWWISGDTLDGRLTICAAFKADSEITVIDTIQAAYDNPHTNLSFRFVDNCPADWSPFSDRFPQADWMEW